MILALHGLGGNGGLWDGLAALAAEPVLAPDLAGHGGAPRLAAYDHRAYAEELSARLGPQLTAEPLWLLGHSLGGVVGLSLIALHRERGAPLPVQGIVALGQKTRWSAEDLAAMHRIADKGPVRFESETAARARYVRVSGLDGLVEPHGPAAARGVSHDADGWRLAADPEVYRMGVSPIEALIAAAACPLLFARGEEDAMAPLADLARLGPPVVELPGLGHNAHVQDPAAVLDLIRSLPIQAGERER